MISLHGGGITVTTQSSAGHVQRPEAGEPSWVLPPFFRPESISLQQPEPHTTVPFAQT